MQGKIKYDFTAVIWQHNSSGGWYFVTLPIELSNEIRENLQWQEEGWGRMKASAQIETMTWDTAIWYDTKLKSYLLPIKSEVRKKLNLSSNQSVEISILL